MKRLQRGYISPQLACIICSHAHGLEESGSDAADDLNEEDAVEDSDDEIELVQEPASTGEGFMHSVMHMSSMPHLHGARF